MYKYYGGAGRAGCEEDGIFEVKFQLNNESVSEIIYSKSKAYSYYNSITSGNKVLWDRTNPIRRLIECHVWEESK